MIFQWPGVTILTRSYEHISVQSVVGGFGAEITGLDLNQTLPAAARAEIKQAWYDHSVVFFPGQVMTPSQQEAFTQQIGEFGHNPFIKAMDDHPNVLEVRREAHETAKNFGAGWHSDWSFQECPPSATILHSKIIPPVGGDTRFADCASAYDALSGTMQGIVEGLTVLHSAAPSYGPKGVFAKETQTRSMEIKPSSTAEKLRAHPLVRRHPGSGRKLLFVNPTYSVRIETLHENESAALLKMLFEVITRDEFIYSHAWQPDTLLMWDNRCVLHSAQGGYDGHRRLMHRTVVAGERPSL